MGVKVLSRPDIEKSKAFSVEIISKKILKGIINSNKISGNKIKIKTFLRSFISEIWMYILIIDIMTRKIFERLSNVSKTLIE